MVPLEFRSFWAFRCPGPPGGAVGRRSVPGPCHSPLPAQRGRDRLTPRECALLEYLLRRRNEVVSKSESLANVWDEFYEGDSNIVEVYVGYLRKKIDVPYARKSIETIRGAGYRLRGDGG